MKAYRVFKGLVTVIFFMMICGPGIIYPDIQIDLETGKESIFSIQKLAKNGNNVSDIFITPENEEFLLESFRDLIYKDDGNYENPEKVVSAISFMIDHSQESGLRKKLLEMYFEYFDNHTGTLGAFATSIAVKISDLEPGTVFSYNVSNIKIHDPFYKTRLFSNYEKMDRAGMLKGVKKTVLENALPSLDLTRLIDYENKYDFRKIVGPAYFDRVAMEKVMKINEIDFFDNLEWIVENIGENNFESVANLINQRCHTVINEMNDIYALISMTRKASLVYNSLTQIEDEKKIKEEYFIKPMMKYPVIITPVLESAFMTKSGRLLSLIKQLYSSVITTSYAGQFDLSINEIIESGYIISAFTLIPFNRVLNIKEIDIRKQVEDMINTTMRNKGQIESLYDIDKIVNYPLVRRWLEERMSSIDEKFRNAFKENFLEIRQERITIEDLKEENEEFRILFEELVGKTFEEIQINAVVKTTVDKTDREAELPVMKMDFSFEKIEIEETPVEEIQQYEIDLDFTPLPPDIYKQLEWKNIIIDKTRT